MDVAKNLFYSALSDGGRDSWITLSHDVHQGTVDILADFMIDTAYDEGYRLVTVGECLSDPRINWYRDSVTGQRYVPYPDATDGDGPRPPTASEGSSSEGDSSEGDSSEGSSSEESSSEESSSEGDSSEWTTESSDDDDWRTPEWSHRRSRKMSDRARG